MQQILNKHVRILKKDTSLRPYITELTIKNIVGKCSLMYQYIDHMSQFHVRDDGTSWYSWVQHTIS